MTIKVEQGVDDKKKNRTFMVLWFSKDSFQKWKPTKKYVIG